MVGNWAPGRVTMTIPGQLGASSAGKRGASSLESLLDFGRRTEQFALITQGSMVGVYRSDGRGYRQFARL